MPSLAALAAYRFSGRNEAAIREDWIRPLLDHLGYGIDTLNEIEYEESVALRKPVRLLGSHRLRVDYLPTVLHRELWLIEAKAPTGDIDSQEHLGQAWSYATHPEIHVPLMALADGSRIVVYDVTRPEWDVPVVDIAASELVPRFGELEAVLGARKVAEFVRRQQIARLGVALRAEIDPSVLDATVREVKALADQARPHVTQNRRAIVQDQAQQDRLMLEQVNAASGMWGIAQHHNGPLGFSRADVEQATHRLLQEPENGRASAFGAFFAAARNPPDGPIRAWWSLRALRLAVALRIREQPGCESVAEEAIRTATRDHLLDFPDDPLSRAAHHFERPLPLVLARLISDPEIVNLPAIETQARATLDEERWIRRPISAAGLARLHIAFGCRRIWAAVDWNETSIGEAAKTMQRLAETLPDPPQRLRLLPNEFDPLTLQWDDLVGYTLIFAHENGRPADIPDEAWPVVATQVDAPGKVGPSARALLAQRNHGDSPSTQ